MKSARSVQYKASFRGFRKCKLLCRSLLIRRWIYDTVAVVWIWEVLEVQFRSMAGGVDGAGAGPELEWKEGEQPLIPTSMVPPKTHSIRIVHVALVIVQLGYAGLQMFSRVALDAGLNQFLLSMYRNMIAFAILGPVAYYFERYRPTPSLVIFTAQSRVILLKSHRWLPPSCSGVRPPMTLKIFGGLNLLALTGYDTDLFTLLHVFIVANLPVALDFQ